MSEENAQAQTSTWSKLTSWIPQNWKERKAPAIAGGIAAFGTVALLVTALLSGTGVDEQDNPATQSVDGGEVVEQVVDTANNGVADDGLNYDAGSNTITLPGDQITDTLEGDVEVEDTVIDSPDEVLDLINELGLSDVFADEVERIQSDNVDVSSQATKDIGHKLANGVDVEENDALANTFFQASYDMNGNVQAAHSIGYQALHGLGMDSANLDLAEDMLTEANDNGHSLAAAHLDYLYKIK